MFGHSELNDLVRDLGLAKESAQLLSSRLKSKNLLAHGTSYSWYRHREKVFTPYFDQENDLVYCTIPKGLVEKFGICYNPEEWRILMIHLKQRFSTWGSQEGFQGYLDG